MIFFFMKRAYFVRNVDADDTTGVGVVAHSISEAKKLAINDLDCEWIDLRVKTIKGDFSDLPLGHIDAEVGLKRGVYYWIEGKCEHCNNPNNYVCLYWDGEIIGCANCVEDSL